MAVVSVLLSFVAFASMGLGLLLTPVPIWGSVFAFLAPALALTGIVLGGLAMSAANKAGRPSGFALAGVIMNVLAFMPAVVVALTCGLCNAVVSTQGNQPPFRMMFPPQLQQPGVTDAGVAPPPFPTDITPPTTPAARDGGPDAPSTNAPSTNAPSTNAPSTTAAPSNGLPPPPIAPGPSR